MNHAVQYLGLYAAYASAGLGWLVIQSRAPGLWPGDAERRRLFKRPWIELVYALAAAIGIVLVGQLYQAGIRLPTTGPLGMLAECVNQALIFSPMILLLVLRRQRLATAWLPRKGVPQRLLVGVCLSLVALLVFLLAHGKAAAFLPAVQGIYNPRHIGKAVQVFLEDMTIAILMCRLSAAIRHPWVAAGIVAILFAAGHIPAVLSADGALAELVGLVFDALLGLFVIRLLQRGADIWWFWCVHFTMDMTQFL